MKATRRMRLTAQVAIWLVLGRDLILLARQQTLRMARSGKISSETGKRVDDHVHMCATYRLQLFAGEFYPAPVLQIEKPPGFFISKSALTELKFIVSKLERVRKLTNPMTIALFPEEHALQKLYLPSIHYLKSAITELSSTTPSALPSPETLSTP